MYWFTLQQQTSTFRWEKFNLPFPKFTLKYNELNLTI